MKIKVKERNKQESQFRVSGQRTRRLKLEFFEENDFRIRKYPFEFVSTPVHEAKRTLPCSWLNKHSSTVSFYVSSPLFVTFISLLPSIHLCFVEQTATGSLLISLFSGKPERDWQELVAQESERKKEWRKKRGEE